MAAHSQPSITDIKIKMKVLRNQLVSRIAGINAHAFDPLQFGMYFQRYRTMAVALRHELPSLFGDLPDGIEAVGDDVVKRGAMIPRDLLWELASEMHFCNEILSKINLSGAGSAHVTKEGAFFAGQTYDALRAVQEIVAQAKTDIFLIDGYIGQHTLDIMTVKPSGATVRLMTLTGSGTPNLKTAAAAFNAQYGGLAIRSSNAFHDRFLIIDDADFYHFGASIKDLGKRGFMFSKIEEPTIIGLLRAEAAREWAAAAVIV